MPRYIAQFEETTVYEVEFESEHSLEDLEEDEDLWFGQLDEQNPGWFTKGLVSVEDRKLLNLKEKEP